MYRFVSAAFWQNNYCLFVSISHEVTSISHFAPKTLSHNYRHITLERFSHQPNGIFSLNTYTGSRKEKWLIIKHKIEHHWKISCTKTFNCSSVQGFLENNNRSFDIIITEIYSSDYFLTFGHNFKVPVVGISYLPITHHTHPTYPPMV